MYLWIFELGAIVLALTVIVTQIVLPAARGTALFPWFRREQHLRNQIVDANQALREDELDQLQRGEPGQALT